MVEVSNWVCERRFLSTEIKESHGIQDEFSIVQGVSADKTGVISPFELRKALLVEVRVFSK